MTMTYEYDLWKDEREQENENRSIFCNSVRHRQCDSWDCECDCHEEEDYEERE